MVLAEVQISESVLALKQVALFVFLALFLGVLVRLWVGKRDVYEKRGQMPLFDDRVLEPRATKAPRQPGEVS